MTAEPTLKDVLTWERHPVASSLAHPTVDVLIGSAGEGGPVGVLTASVHGDEGPWGTLAINGLLASTPASALRGTLRVVPVAHPLATEADARQSHLDNLDLNNSFPGDAHGTHTQRLAAIIAEHALDGADVLLDVHGGGSWNVNCFTYRFAGGEQLAEWIGTPLILDGPLRSTSLTGYVIDRGGIGVWIEMGGRGEFEEQRAQAVATGLRRALGRTGVLTDDGPADAPGVVASARTALTVSRPGIYRPLRRESDLGTVVDQGTTIGELLDPITGEVLETFVAPYPRTILALLRPTLARIEGVGQVVAMVADVS